MSRFSERLTKELHRRLDQHAGDAAFTQIFDPMLGISFIDQVRAANLSTRRELGCSCPERVSTMRHGAAAGAARTVKRDCRLGRFRSDEYGIHAGRAAECVAPSIASGDHRDSQEARVKSSSRDIPPFAITRVPGRSIC